MEFKRFPFFETLPYQGQRVQSALIGGRIVGFIPYIRILALCEMQAA